MSKPDYVCAYCPNCEQQWMNSEFTEDADPSECPRCGELLYDAPEED